MLIIKYETEEEKQTIITNKIALGFTLVEISNITEGNFLGFVEGTTIVETPIQPTNIEIQETQMTILSGIADVYMATLGF